MSRAALSMISLGCSLVYQDIKCGCRTHIQYAIKWKTVKIFLIQYNKLDGNGKKLGVRSS